MILTFGGTHFAMSARRLDVKNADALVEATVQFFPIWTDTQAVGSFHFVDAIV